jgi:hypothetical protein
MPVISGRAGERTAVASVPRARILASLGRCFNAALSVAIGADIGHRARLLNPRRSADLPFVAIQELGASCIEAMRAPA